MGCSMNIASWSAKFVDQQTLWPKSKWGHKSQVLKLKSDFVKSHLRSSDSWLEFEWSSHVTDDPTQHWMIFWMKKWYYAILFQNLISHFVFCGHFLSRMISHAQPMLHNCFCIETWSWSLHSKQSTPGFIEKDIYTWLTIWPWTDGCLLLCLNRLSRGGKLLQGFKSLL